MNGDLLREQPPPPYPWSSINGDGEQRRLTCTTDTDGTLLGEEGTGSCSSHVTLNAIDEEGEAMQLASDVFVDAELCTLAGRETTL